MMRPTDIRYVISAGMDFHAKYSTPIAMQTMHTTEGRRTMCEMASNDF